ncbi:putative fimbrial chaperone YraI [Saezia sanguinis]|uniref:Putative fimbrial chaperone YraI n=1 Tax=Saezia sanguinis TaxID=1965230 RepID=A0A433SB69_9BURK|nr:molecular chaperone [Saezia sanguinis]RUS65982.1 putative fimbrial chaperone YraI [Saezia sanguinis]
MNTFFIRHFFYLIFLLLGGLVIFEPVYGKGISVGGTRVIYDASKREATLSVRNSADGIPHLIQSWADDFSDPGFKAPFIITPPLFRLDAGKENILRIVFTGETNLPQDRESVFWLNVKAIPAVEKTEANQLTIAIKTRIKLFYRPTSLRTDEANDAWKKLTFIYVDGVVVIQNPTPYFVSLFSLQIGHDNVPMPPMIAPFSESLVPIINKVDVTVSVTWQAINDYGAITSPSTAQFADKSIFPDSVDSHGMRLSESVAAP